MVKTFVILAALVCAAADAEAADIYTCSGKVIDQADKPVAGARVELYVLTPKLDPVLPRTERLTDVQSASDGTFTLTAEKDEDNDYRMFIVLVHKEGMSLGWINWYTYQSKTLKQDVMLTQPAVLAGVVVDEKGGAIAGAEVEVSLSLAKRDTKRPQWMTGRLGFEDFKTRTDEKGHFSFDGIPTDATAEFTACAAGRAKISTLKNRLDPRLLQFSAGTTDVRIVLPLEAKITGRVINGKNQPVGGVRLHARAKKLYTGWDVETTTSGEDGTFEFTNLRSDTYTLDLVPQADKPMDWVAKPVTVAVEAGKTKTGISVVLQKGGLVEIVVTDSATKKPIEKASVSLSDTNRSKWFHGRTDEKGTARIRVLPGDYQLNHVQSSKKYAMVRPEESLSVKDGETVRLAVQMNPRPMITGTVTDPDGKPVAGATVKVLPGGGRQGSAQTDVKGYFELNWDPGWWGRESTVFYLVARSEQHNLAATADIDEETKTVDLKLAPAATITGLVVDPENKPIHKARVTLYMRAARWGAPLLDEPVHTDNQGRYTIVTVPVEHKYGVYAEAEGYGRRDVQVSLEGESAKRVDVETLQLDLANLVVKGTVVDEDDKPVPNAQVYCHGQTQPHRSTATDTQGKFVIEKICKGSIQINANVQGQNRKWGSVGAQGGDESVRIVVAAQGGSRQPQPTTAPKALSGKPLPKWREVKVTLDPEQTKSRMILVCFWDMSQRPSRHVIRTLAKKAGNLAKRGVVIVSVHTSSLEPEKLKQCTTRFNISFPVGSIEGDRDKMLRQWGVKSLPWLILTDRNHTVRAEGFAPAQLESKIDSIEKK